MINVNSRKTSNVFQKKKKKDKETALADAH